MLKTIYCAYYIDRIEYLLNRAKPTKLNYKNKITTKKKMYYLLFLYFS